MRWVWLGYQVDINKGTAWLLTEKLDKLQSYDWANSTRGHRRRPSWPSSMGGKKLFPPCHHISSLIRFLAKLAVGLVNARLQLWNVRTGRPSVVGLVAHQSGLVVCLEVTWLAPFLEHAPRRIAALEMLGSSSCSRQTCASCGGPHPPSDGQRGQRLCRVQAFCKEGALLGSC